MNQSPSKRFSSSALTNQRHPEKTKELSELLNEAEVYSNWNSGQQKVLLDLFDEEVMYSDGHSAVNKGLSNP